MNERRSSSSGSQPAPSRLRRRKTDLVRVPSPFPAVEGVPGRPRWWQRVRGIFGMTILVGVLGVLVAIAVAVLLVLIVVAVVSVIT